MKTVKLALFLAIVAGLSGAALSYVYSVTDPIIQEAAIASEKENLVKIYTGGEEFKAVEANATEYPAIQGIYSAGDKGYVYKCSVVGYGGGSTPIKYLIGLDKDGSYKGYIVLDATGETSGFGSKVADKEFVSSIVGKKMGDGIDAITGATISSQAVIDGIDQATAHFEENFK